MRGQVGSQDKNIATHREPASLSHLDLLKISKTINQKKTTFHIISTITFFLFHVLYNLYKNAKITFDLKAIQV